MSNDLLNYLTSSPRQASISPDMLETMGKQAANMFLDTGLSLNEAIVKIASPVEDINVEQIKRVAEFANTAVYLAKHDQSKTAGAESSYPQFELADPARILQDLSDGARPTVVTKTDLDYSRQPAKKEKVSSDRSDAILAEMFNVKEASARDELSFTRDTAAHEIQSAKEALVSLRDHLSGVGEQFDMIHMAAADEFFTEAKKHLLDGGSFADVLAAAHSSGADKEKVSEAMKPFVERLLKDKVATARKLSRDTGDFAKVAHRMVNEEHPMVIAFRAMLAADAEIEKVASGLEQVEAELKTVQNFIREKFIASQAD